MTLKIIRRLTALFSKSTDYAESAKNVHHKTNLKQKSDEFISELDILKHDPDVVAYEDSKTQPAKLFMEETRKIAEDIWKKLS